MSLRFFTGTRTGEIQSRLQNDVGGVQNVVTNTASSMLSNIVIVLSTVDRDAAAVLAADAARARDRAAVRLPHLARRPGAPADLEARRRSRWPSCRRSPRRRCRSRACCWRRCSAAGSDAVDALPRREPPARPAAGAPADGRPLVLRARADVLLGRAGARLPVAGARRDLSYGHDRRVHDAADPAAVPDRPDAATSVEVQASLALFERDLPVPRPARTTSSTARRADALAGRDPRPGRAARTSGSATRSRTAPMPRPARRRRRPNGVRAVDANGRSRTSRWRSSRGSSPRSSARAAPARRRSRT